MEKKAFPIKGRDLLLILFSVGLSVILTLIITSAAFPGKETVQASLSNQRWEASKLEDRISKESRQLREYISSVARLINPSEYAKLSDIPSLKDYAKLSDLQEVLLKLEARPQEATQEVEELITKWSTDISFVSPNAHTENYIELHLDHKRIRDEGSYEIDLEIENTGDIDYTIHPIFKVVLVPDSLTQIGEDETFLDSNESPWIDWSKGDFHHKERKGETYCRRITFVSKKHEEGITIEAGDTWRMELLFELVYK